MTRKQKAAVDAIDAYMDERQQQVLDKVKEPVAGWSDAFQDKLHEMRTTILHHKEATTSGSVKN